MKKYTIDIHPKLKDVTFTVKNGAAFERALIAGHYGMVGIQIAPEDIIRVKKFAVKFADDKNSNRGNWYAHCNGYCMDLFVDYNGQANINTYAGYRRFYKDINSKANTF
jgi:hypothetical protein